MARETGTPGGKNARGAGAGAANFPGGEGWTFRGVSCGTPGEFPEGADYGVGYEGKAPAYLIGYRSASPSLPPASEADGVVGEGGREEL